MKTNIDMFKGRGVDSAAHEMLEVKLTSPCANDSVNMPRMMESLNQGQVRRSTAIRRLITMYEYHRLPVFDSVY